MTSTTTRTIPAGDVEVGDRVIASDGRALRVESIERAGIAVRLYFGMHRAATKGVEVPVEVLVEDDGDELEAREDLERATRTLDAIAERTAVGQRLEGDDTDEAILRRVVRQSRDRLEGGHVEAPAAPIILVTTGHPTLHQHPGAGGENVHPRLGRLIQPRHTSSIELTAAAGIPWAADNDCFQGLDEVAFVRMLDRIAGLPGCLFATVPDVVGDSAATLAMFERWAPELERRGIPAGYVAQDGATAESTPWARVAAIFIGGSNDYKLGPDAAELAREAKRRGKWVHWGRVNTRRRFDLIVATGAADSFDGSKWARWRKTYLPTALEWLDEAAQARRAALEAPATAVRLRPRTVVVEGRELLAVAGGSPELDDAELSDEDRREATRIRRGLERAGIGANPRIGAMRREAAALRAGNGPEGGSIAELERAGVLEGALRAYRTDAELEVAERLSGAQDYTDGGGPIGPDGRRLDRD